jgi:glucosylceramidase
MLVASPMKTSVARTFSAIPLAIAGVVLGAACGESSSATSAAGGTSSGATGSPSTAGSMSAMASQGSSSGRTVGAGSGSTQMSQSGTSVSSASTSTSSSPSLITSGPGAYWNTGGQLTKLAGGAADVTVDPNTTYQRWDGFGGTFNEMGWDALSVVSSQIPTALKLLFDPNDGANFVYGRVPLGASDYAMSWYTCDDTANDYTMANFSLARDQQMLIPYIQAALQVRPDIHLWASPWNPPSWMRDSSTGNMLSDAQTLQAYALYFSLFVEGYAKLGLTIEAIHPQNEPGYAWAKWPGTLYIDFIKTYLGPMFAQRNVPAEIWCGTMSAPADGTLATTLAADPEAMKYVKGFGLQWNTASVASALSLQGPVMQTEHRCGNYPFAETYWNVSEYNPNMPPNDNAYGEESWKLLRDWITAGVNSYLAWNMVLDTTGKSLNGWPQNALLVVDRTAKTLTETPAYYVFRQFSQFILQGATRIGVTGTNDAVAFQNPDGSIVTEVYNDGAEVYDAGGAANTANTVTVAVAGTVYQFGVPAHGWATLIVPR